MNAKFNFFWEMNKGRLWTLLSSPLITLTVYFCYLRISNKFVIVVKPQEETQYLMRD